MSSDAELQSTLVGERVIIRPVEAADWEGMFAAASDPEIWVLHPESDRYQEDVFRRYFDGALDSGSAFSIVDTVVFWVGEANLRSRRAVEKIGGVLRDGVEYRDGTGDDASVVYEINRK